MLSSNSNNNQFNRNLSDSQHWAIALILAAGSSTRMGTCKASLPWLEGHTLLSYQVKQWQQAGVSPVVVLGPHNAHLQLELPSDCRVVINPNPSLGKTSSILLGLHCLPTVWTVLAIAAVDQPRPTYIYQTLLKQHLEQAKTITVPTFEGQQGHPILFTYKMLPDLQAIQEEQFGLRQVIKNYTADIHRVEMNDPIVHADLNIQEIYLDWLKRLSSQVARETIPEKPFD